MIEGRSSLVAVALLCGALVAGCGSSSSSTSGSTASTPVATSKAAPTPAPIATTSGTPTATSSASPGAVSVAGVAQYVAICKSLVEREPTLPANVKSKVEGICAKAAHGDLAGARTAAKEVCVEVITASPISASEKAQALAACKTA